MRAALGTTLPPPYLATPFPPQTCKQYTYTLCIYTRTICLNISKWTLYCCIQRFIPPWLTTSGLVARKRLEGELGDMGWRWIIFLSTTCMPWVPNAHMLYGIILHFSKNRHLLHRAFLSHVCIDAAVDSQTPPQNCTRLSAECAVFQMCVLFFVRRFFATWSYVALYVQGMQQCVTCFCCCIVWLLK